MLTVLPRFLSTSAGRTPAASVWKHDSADPSDYERRHRMCLSKVPYLTKNDAIYAAKHRQKKCGKDLRRYRCPYCGRIHLTSKPPQEHPKAAKVASTREHEAPW